MIRQSSFLAIFLPVISSVLLFPAFAQDKCANAETQQEMNQCAGQSYKKADAQLNKLYRGIEKRLVSDKNTLKLLVSAQRAWVKYRDAECTFASSSAADGSLYPVIYGQCLETLTSARIKEFEAYLKCEEGDMSCPVPPAE